MPMKLAKEGFIIADNDFIALYDIGSLFAIYLFKTVFSPVKSVLDFRLHPLLQYILVLIPEFL